MRLVKIYVYKYIYYKKIGLVIKKIQLVEKEVNANKTLCLENLNIIKKEKQLSEWDVLMIKDELCIANKKYAKLREKWNLQDHLPTLTKLIDLKNMLDSAIKINKDYYGAVNDMQQKLKVTLESIVRRLKLNERVDRHGRILPIRLKFGGDGTQVGKTIKILNLTFTCLNDVDLCKSAFGNYSIGIWQIEEENYDTLSRLQTLLYNLQNTNEIKVDGVVLEIQWFNGSDYKFILNLYGNFL
jgi:hypothetical protein